jgi:hypothetical protein
VLPIPTEYLLSAHPAVVANRKDWPQIVGEIRAYDGELFLSKEILPLRRFLQLRKLGDRYGGNELG